MEYFGLQYLILRNITTYDSAQGESKIDLILDTTALTETKCEINPVEM